MGLFEIKRRVANTEAGQLQLNYEKAIAMLDAYGGMYRSINRGWEFNRIGISCRTEFKYNIEYGTNEDWDDDEDEG